MTRQLMILDMDGVIYRGHNFWLELHHILGTQDAALDMWHRMGLSDYETLSRQTAKLWQGRSAAPYFRLVAERRPTWGIRKLLRRAVREGVYTALVSSGAWHLARRAQEDYGLDEVHANRLGIDREGRFDGTVEVQVDDARKDVRVREIQARLGVPPQRTLVIGDSGSDVPMVELAAHSIGYRVKDRAVRERFGTKIDGRSIAEAEGALGTFVAAAG